MFIINRPYEDTTEEIMPREYESDYPAFGMPSRPIDNRTPQQILDDKREKESEAASDKLFFAEESSLADKRYAEENPDDPRVILQKLAEQKITIPDFATDEEMEEFIRQLNGEPDERSQEKELPQESRRNRQRLGRRSPKR